MQAWLESLRPRVEVTEQSLRQKGEEDRHSLKRLFLGEGAEAKVDAVFDPYASGSNFYVMKTYHEEKRASRDFKIMRKLARLEKQKLLPGFRIAKVYGYRGNQLKMEFIEGIPLDYLFTSKQIADSRQAQILYTKFRLSVYQMLKNMKGRFSVDLAQRSHSVRHILKHFCEDALSDYSHQILVAFYKRKTVFQIKPENILLDINTGEMVIIDPI